MGTTTNTAEPGCTLGMVHNSELLMPLLSLLLDNLKIQIYQIYNPLHDIIHHLSTKSTTPFMTSSIICPDCCPPQPRICCSLTTFVYHQHMDSLVSSMPGPTQQHSPSSPAPPGTPAASPWTHPAKERR